MKKTSVPDATKLTLSKTTIKNLGVQSGVQAGFKINSTPCATLTKNVACLP